MVKETSESRRSELTPSAEVAVEQSDATCKQKFKNGEFDATCIALKPKARVLRIIGRPTRMMGEDPLPPNFDGYPWGNVYYENGVLKAFTYNYPVVPLDYPWGPQALEWVGLKKTSEPYDAGFVVGWDKSSGHQLVCCGFVIEMAGMLKTMAQITVRFDRKIPSH